MKVGMQNYNKSGHDGVTQTWDIMQKDFKCCGVESYENWQNTTLPTGELFRISTMQISFLLFKVEKIDVK